MNKEFDWDLEKWNTLNDHEKDLYVDEVLFNNKVSKAREVNCVTEKYRARIVIEKETMLKDVLLMHPEVKKRKTSSIIV
jgi:hypothetical protein